MRTNLKVANLPSWMCLTNGRQPERKKNPRENSKKEADYKPKGVHQKLDPVEHMQLAGQRNFYGAT